MNKKRNSKYVIPS